VNIKDLDYKKIRKIRPLSGYCPYCHKHVAFSWVCFNEYSHGDIQKYLDERNSYKNSKGVWAIGECPSCKNCVLVHFPISGKVRIFPSPLPSPTDGRIPEEIRKDLDEAKICFSVNAFRACAVMCRRALQTACKTKGATKERLMDQIDELAEKGVITNDLKELAHAVRWVGNDAAHPNEKEVTKEEAEEILHLTEQFMHVLFVAPAKVREIKEKRTIKS